MNFILINKEVNRKYIPSKRKAVCLYIMTP
jgi:hypothetical protein